MPVHVNSWNKTYFNLFVPQFFYVITEIYKEGVLKEMQKWAYEVHSTFLVPGAPLRIPGLEQSSIVNDIDR